MAKQLNWSSCPRWVAGFEAAEAKAALDAARVSQIVKTASSRGRLGGPCLDTVILALRRRALAGRRNAADRRNRYFEITLRLATPEIRPAGADAFAVVSGGCTGRAHGCKAKQGRRSKGGADVWLLVPQ
jgi:hypothetical protein